MEKCEVSAMRSDKTIDYHVLLITADHLSADSLRNSHITSCHPCHSLSAKVSPLSVSEDR